MQLRQDISMREMQYPQVHSLHNNAQREQRKVFVVGYIGSA